LAEEDQQPETASRTDHQKLLDLLLDANKTAQADTLSKIRTTISVADDIGQNRVDALELHYAELAKDIGRLEGLATQLTEQAPPLRPENASELRDTENQLAQFKQDLDALISSGVLELPAAAMVSQAAAPRSDGLIHRWAVIVPLAAALSVLLAMILASLLSRYRRRRQPNAAERSAGETIPRVKEAVADNKVSSVLTDPYWPMSPKQRLENLQEDAT
jgi:membrane protein implicated in regulation of membrane protease activity